MSLDFEELAKLPPSKRIKPLLIDLLPTLACCAFWVFLCMLIASAAHAAVHPDTTMPTIRPEKALERDKPKSAVCGFRTVIVLLRFKDGRVMMFPMAQAVPC